MIAKYFFVMLWVTNEYLPVPILNDYLNPDLKRLRHDEAYRREVFKGWEKQFYGDVYRYCYKFFGKTEADDVVQVKDIVQVVFQVVWSDLHKFKGDSTVKTWIIGIARHKCMNLLRDRRHRRALLKKFEAEIGRGLHHGTERLAENEAVDRLTECLAKLKDYDRLILNLRFCEEKSYQDIAKVAGKKIATVRQHVHRILEQLRDWMHDDLD
jgi:RNA polymerase sigma-70 factor (ECF subfamily)